MGVGVRLGSFPVLFRAWVPHSLTIQHSLDTTVVLPGAEGMLNARPCYQPLQLPPMGGTGPLEMFDGRDCDSWSPIARPPFRLFLRDTEFCAVNGLGLKHLKYTRVQQQEEFTSEILTFSYR